MEVKHFSHNHGLEFHQMPQGAKGQCSGCKTPVSGNIYACWQCNHFLHEQCFHAARSLRHPSHPSHSLTLVSTPTHQSGSFHCQSCNVPGNGLSYTCAECQFDIHVHCALSPNQNPQISSFSTPTSTHSYNPHLQNQNPIYPRNDSQNFSPHHYNARPRNPTHPHYNTQNFNAHSPHPQPNHSIPVSPPYNSPPPNAATLPPPLPPPFYPSTNQATVGGGLTNPNIPFRPNYHVPNYNSQASLSNPSAQTATVPTYVNVTTATTIPPSTPPSFNPVVNQSPQNDGLANPNIMAAHTHVSNYSPQSPWILKHFSHPHALQIIEKNTNTEDICSACECYLSKTSYRCTEPHCTFNLHKACFDSPVELFHTPYHPHPLKLVVSPRYPNGSFTCDACYQNGKTFAYICETCSFDLHIDCISWPEKTNVPYHKHELTLYYSSASIQNGTFICNTCNSPGHESAAWAYYCRECNFGTHLECMAAEVKPERKSISAADELASFRIRCKIEAETQEAILDLWDDKPKKKKYVYI